MLTIDAVVLSRSTEQEEASLLLPRTPEWLFPLTGAIVAHLCFLVFILAAPRSGVVRESMPEVLPVTLYTTGQLPTVVLPGNSSKFRAATAPVRPSQVARPKRSNEPVTPARVALSPPVAATMLSGVSGLRPSPPQEVVHQKVASEPMQEGAAGHGSSEVDAGTAGTEAAVVLARPRYRANPSPPYPEQARRRQLEGTVVLEVLVSTEGKVSELIVHYSSNHRLLDEAALQTVRLWLFEPGRRSSVPIAMKILVPVRFDLH